MQRKTVQISKNTLMLTLPSKWVQTKKIQKGDVINITETQSGLLLQPIANDSIAKIEIRVVYENQETRDIIINLMHMFAGLAISNQDSNSLVLKVITKERTEEFDALLRKDFLVTISLADGCLEAFLRRNFSDLKNLLILENTNNQFSNFCERIIIKKGYIVPEQTCFIFFTIMNLERIGDFYRYIIDFVCENQTKIKTTSNLKNIFERVNNLLGEFYNLFYNFEIEKLSLFYKDQTEIGDLVGKIFKTNDYYEIVIAHYLMDIVTLIVDSVPGAIMVNQK